MKKLRPILFSTPMVQAILDGRKTQTRRVVKPQPIPVIPETPMSVEQFKFKGKELKDIMFVGIINETGKHVFLKCPYGKVGDVLWVRETFGRGVSGKTYFKADKGIVDKLVLSWKPSIHMPFEAARIFLEITDVRVQRLQHITPMDAVEEGIAIASRFGDEVNTWMCYGDDTGTTNSAYYSFLTLWQSINGRDSWYDNPWVWVVEFKRISKEEALQ